MPFYHATFRKHLPSIMRHGLGGAPSEQNWPGCAPGVYLAEHPAICALVMIEQYVRYGDPDSVPRDHLDEMVILVVDDARIDRRFLTVDVELPRDDVRLYTGVIDVRGLPIIPLAAVDTFPT